MNPEIGCFWNQRVTMGQRQVSHGFKVKAVNLVRERGASAARAARNLDAHEKALRKCVCNHPGFALAVAPSASRGYPTPEPCQGSPGGEE